MTLLVTGGASGIGAAVVAAARSRGETVHVVDVTTGVDAADPVAVGEFVDAVGTPDRVAHLAGVVSAGGIEETSLAEWERTLRNNLTSAFVVSQAVVPRMAARGGGSLVLMSSLNARDGGTRLSGTAYAAAKAGVLGLMRHLAVDYGPRGVRVNAVAPGPVATPMHDRLTAQQKAALRGRMPLGRVAAAEEIADIVLFLLSDSCATVTGMTFDVNGGSHLS
ncbi:MULTISPECIES: SDR family oxidoreductase [unclassified Micromonospora]|uniref:SDR family NAD(P)-dependent oxidoreductase n=1 Tax=Micromonospora TaxID=1873 RepID=UPI0024170135|nr:MULTISPECIES: SDR family oxidoreductase [unclassified Micromonospora]MDG4819857.1 SDR family oxidoreductase [Micromonospora sp. WMMD956]WFE56277.1 SDR family oxidoreductase [Micromonospora sp. WMMD712]